MSRREDRDSGAVTVEAALGIGSLVVVFALALAGMFVVIGQLRCTDAAIEAARLIARGERHRTAEVLDRLAPAGARSEVIVRGEVVITTVSSPSLGGVLPGHLMKSRASAVLEPGVAAAGS